MSIQIELVASLAPGTTKAPQMQNPDGSSSPFVIPAGEAFVATDISANRISVLGTPVLVALNLEQNLGAGASSLGGSMLEKLRGTSSARLRRAFASPHRLA